ncbi:MAG: hypothetical protein ABJC12_11375, partial [Saprospiraceae bacterium]
MNIDYQVQTIYLHHLRKHLRLLFNSILLIRKKFIMRALIILAFLLTYCSRSFCQADSEERLKVHLIAKVENEHVFLRWIPGNLKSWYWGISHGYRVIRYTTSDDGGYSTWPISWQVDSKIVLDTLLPYSAEDISSIEDAESDQKDLASGILYEPSFIIDSLIGESGFARAYADQSDRESRFVFGLIAADQNFSIARAFGLGYIDDPYNDGAYYYEVEFLDQVDSTFLGKGGVDVNMYTDYSLRQPGIPQIEQAIDTNILLSWDVSLLESIYGSYNIERSTDSSNFTKINTLPLVSVDQNGNDQSVVYFADDVPGMDSDYYYQVKGVSPFGDEGPASPIVKVRPKPSPKASPPKITNLDIVSDDVNVDWDFPSGEDSLIWGFKIY